MDSLNNTVDTGSFQLDEFYLDLQEDGSKISLLDKPDIVCCPYPGLRPFRTSEFQLFKGREGQAEELLRRLRSTHFLAVIGSSGTGKSSLIRAGLIPQLYGGYLHEAGSRWNIAICRPGRNPVENLSVALSRLRCGTSDRQAILEENSRISPLLHRSVYGILEVNEKLPAGSDGIRSNLLIIIDQFEELFRFERKDAGYVNIEAHFVNLLLKASLRLDSSVYVIVTMRSEFLGKCVKFRGLPEIINEGQYLVPQLDRTQVKEAIEAPLVLAGRKIEPGLSETLINEIEQTRLRENLDQLPILQHALMRTYKEAMSVRGNDTMRLADYLAVGGMDKALARHAEACYEQLADPNDIKFSQKQLIAKVVFQALTDLSSDQEGGRRPVQLVNLYAITAAIGASPEATNEVIDTFRALDTSFVMPPVSTPLNPGLIIDISHESLMRNWDTLNTWMLDEVRQGELYGMLDERRELSEQEVKKDNWIRGILLKELLKWRSIPYHNSVWAARYHKNATLAEAAKLYKKNIDFLNYSEKQNTLADQQEVKALEAQIKLDVTRRISWITGIVAVIAIVLGLVAFIGMRKARTNQRDAEEKTLKANKALFGIYLRDSTQWWNDPLLTQTQKDSITDRLFYLYSESKTHKPSHADSLTGMRMESSLVLLKKADSAFRLDSWGNYLALLKEAKDSDANFITVSIFDSLLTATIPYTDSQRLDPADRSGGYLLAQPRETPGAAFILVNQHGIYQYSNRDHSRETKLIFPKNTDPRCIAANANRLLTLQGRQFMLYERDPRTNTWKQNTGLSAKIGRTKVAQRLHTARDSNRLHSSILSELSSAVAEDVDRSASSHVAAFSADGSRLVVYLGNLGLRSVDFNTGKVQDKSVETPVQQLVFSHHDSRLLVCTDSSTSLIDLGNAAALPVNLALTDSAVAPSGISSSGYWKFSTDDTQIYAYVDSSRYSWAGTGKGQYLGKTKTMVGKIAGILLRSLDTLLYTHNKVAGAFNTTYDTKNGQDIYVQSDLEPGSIRLMPWHRSNIQYMFVTKEGTVVSGDETTVYTWYRQSKHLREDEIDRYLDSPRLMNYYSQTANNFILAYKLPDAIAWYLKAAAYGPLTSTQWSTIGNYWLDSPTPDSAAPYYKKAWAAETDTTNTRNLTSIGNAYYRGDKYDSAVKYFSMVLKRNSAISNSWNDLANVYYTLHNYDSAIRLYRHAVSIEPTDTVLLTNLARAYQDKEQYDSAVAYTKKAIAINPNYHDALLILAYGLYAVDQSDSSLRYCLRAVAQRPDDPAAWNQLGSTYEDLQENEKALVGYNKAIALNDQNVQYLVNRAELYNRKLGNYKAAKADADSCIQLNPTYSGGYDQQGYSYLMTGKRDAAYKSFMKAMEVEPNSWGSYFYLACYYAATNDRARTLSNLKMAIANGLHWRSTVDQEQTFKALKNDKEFKAIRASMPRN